MVKAEQFWSDKMAKLEHLWKDGIPSDFLDYDEMNYALCSTLEFEDIELPMLEKVFSSDELDKILDVPDYGFSKDGKFAQYHRSTTIHHVYHLLNYLDGTGKNIQTSGSILEWGGGWGNMARLFRNHLCEIGHTYTIVDLPFMCRVQYEYLTNTTSARVNVNKYEPGCINLIDVDHLDRMPHRHASFISTWALSESGWKWQDRAVTHNWYNAQNILLAFDPNHQDVFKDTDHFSQIISKDGQFFLMDAYPAEGSIYAFK